MQAGHGHGLPSKWEKTYEAANAEELLLAYAEWAPTYDEDSIGRFGYAAPVAAADALAAVLRSLGVEENAAILDAGAGTGQVGQRLAELGFQNLIGVDLSPEMLANAKAKACYTQLLCADLHDASIVGHGSLAALVCVGTLMLPNHVVTGSVLRSWLLWLRPGGVVCLSVRTDQWDNHSTDPEGLPAVARALEDEGEWKLLSATEPKPYTPLVTGERIKFMLRVYQRR
mmetsp:Transcript_55631/g.130347  ORF Transcript_55631/g.130347 Transcript_55631/m.130347 type:complete len:228 (+) Transcript_55631:210-893(+)